MRKLLWLVALVGCKGSEKSAPLAAAGSGSITPEMMRNAPSKYEGGAKDVPAPSPVAAMELERGKADEDRKAALAQAHAGGVLAADALADKPNLPAAKKPAAPAETVTRSWFPETFLFEPLIVTDTDGNATVPVKVPDRLTTWRVLALAHSRSGAQGGAVTSFAGTLPTYVDLVVPPFLVVGDEIKLPIQLVNTTDKPVTETLTLAAAGATLTGKGGPRTIPAQGSLVEYATLYASSAGTIAVKAQLGGTDAVQRTIDVVPSGKPVTVTKTGTLAAPRTLAIDGPAGADPGADRVRLQVYPGALAILRSELGVSTARAGVADDAYALLLAGKATQLLSALGDKADPVAIRDLSLLVGQRAIRDARTLDVDRAALLVEAALAHGNNPVLSRLGERAADYLAKNQRPDGTFAGGTGWTLQRVMVATAEAARAVGTATGTTADKQRAQGVLARAGGAFARNAAQVTDAYTAAWLLASGAVQGALADTLRTRVRDAIQASDDGAKYLPVGDGVVRADGSVPGRAEATALAALALSGDPKAPLADLGATLLGGYDPIAGWGDGRANLVCIRAVLELFKTPVPPDVKISLTMDGRPIASGTLDREKLREVLALDVSAPGLAGKHTWAIAAEPPVPGLGFSLALRVWAAWEREPTRAGLELQLAPKLAGSVGKPIDLEVKAIAPAGVSVHIQMALPAGVQPDRPSLDALVGAKTIERFETADGTIDLYVSALQPGQTFTARYRVIPTLAGTLRSAASLVEGAGQTFHVPPTDWVIK
jgi:alpha-2-macroglobulin family protein